MITMALQALSKALRQSVGFVSVNAAKCVECGCGVCAGTKGWDHKCTASEAERFAVSASSRAMLSLQMCCHLLRSAFCQNVPRTRSDCAGAAAGPDLRSRCSPSEAGLARCAPSRVGDAFGQSCHHSFGDSEPPRYCPSTLGAARLICRSTARLRPSSTSLGMSARLPSPSMA